MSRLLIKNQSRTKNAKQQVLTLFCQRHVGLTAADSPNNSHRNHLFQKQLSVIHQALLTDKTIRLNIYLIVMQLIDNNKNLYLLSATPFIVSNTIKHRKNVMFFENADRQPVITKNRIKIPTLKKQL
ncbi:hypothetical protein ACRRRU_20355 [Dickeya fangzhongdai]|uniref:hypothetical protein n=1 Tax=Dickeya fangzhongdai TaxID=1778540 RepID=UPI0013C4E21A|nr:hypothetical protein [Dickeya fangzhongdai]